MCNTQMIPMCIFSRLHHSSLAASLAVAWKRTCKLRLLGFKKKCFCCVLFCLEQKTLIFCHYFLTTESSNFIFGMCILLMKHFQTTLGSSGGRVVKLLACGARGPGFDSRPCHSNFQRLVISCFKVKIWLKDR